VLKALDESESYTAENLPSECRGIGSLSYALVLVIQLMLNSVATTVYFDSARIDSTVPPATKQNNLMMYQDLFKQLSESFTQLEFVPVSKGRHMEALRNKLTQLLNCRSTNEIQQENLREIMCRFTEYGDTVPTQANTP